MGHFENGRLIKDEIKPTIIYYRYDDTIIGVNILNRNLWHRQLFGNSDTFDR